MNRLLYHLLASRRLGLSCELGRQFRPDSLKSHRCGCREGYHRSFGLSDRHQLTSLSSKVELRDLCSRLIESRLLFPASFYPGVEDGRQRLPRPVIDCSPVSTNRVDPSSGKPLDDRLIRDAAQLTKLVKRQLMKLRLSTHEDLLAYEITAPRK